MEIIFITGKGGVGKSAVAAAFARKMAKQGKRTLLVELGDQSFYQDYLNLKQVHYHPEPSGMGFDVALWSGPECLREYALHLIKIETLYKLFFENPVTKALVNVAPGLAELAIVGKITSGPPRNVGPKLNYDVIVVDGYSTGHFLALMRAPEGMSKTITLGPMGEQSREILSVLKDSNLCKFFIVTLPEELPTLEGLELGAELNKELGIRPTFLMNKYVQIPEVNGSSVEEPGSELEKENYKSFLSNLKHTKKRVDDLQSIYQSKESRLFKIPFIFSHGSTEVIEKVSQELPDV